MTDEERSRRREYDRLKRERVKADPARLARKREREKKYREQAKADPVKRARTREIQRAYAARRRATPEGKAAAVLARKKQQERRKSDPKIRELHNASNRKYRTALRATPEGYARELQQMREYAKRVNADSERLAKAQKVRTQYWLKTKDDPIARARRSAYFKRYNEVRLVSDAHIRYVLCKGTNIDPSLLTPDLIEAKRLQLLIERKCREERNRIA